MSSDLLNEQQRAKLLESLRRNLGQTIMTALSDPDVVEIYVNEDGFVRLDTFSQGMYKTGTQLSRGDLDSIMRNIAAFLGVIVTKDHPVLEGELPLDGSRFEGVIPPLVTSPVFTIRKKAQKIFTLDDYLAANIITQRQREILRDAVASARNVLVVGGTSSGKTTLLNALIQEVKEVDPGCRMIMIEDTYELQCPLDDKVNFKTSEDVDMTALLRVSMRMHPTRITVGEMRGMEALALLKAWNSGHSGGFATIHADSVLDGLIKLNEYVMENQVPSKMDLICRAVNYVVYIEKTTEGRKVQSIGRIDGYNRERNLVEYKEVE